MQRFTTQADVAGGFIGAASDWMRLSKSSPFPPPPWLRVPEGTTDRERAAERDDEALRCKVSSAQEMIDNNRERFSYVINCFLLVPINQSIDRSVKYLIH